MSAVPKPKLTPLEYLAIERKAAFRSEYYRGEVIAMAGASFPHTRITPTLASELFARLKGTTCFVLTQDIRVNVSATGLYTYPDVVIVCGPPEFVDGQFDTLLNPRVLIEVLSPSTEAYHRGEKFRQVRQLPSLQEYVLVAQDQASVELFTRQENGGWLLTTFAGLDAEASFSSVAAKVPLSDIYAGIVFPETPGRT